MRALPLLLLLVVVAFARADEADNLAECVALSTDCGACLSFVGDGFNCTWCDAGFERSACVTDDSIGHSACVNQVNGTVAIDSDTDERFCIEYLTGTDCDPYMPTDIDDVCVNATKPYTCNSTLCNFAAIQACPYFAYGVGWNASGCVPAPRIPDDTANVAFIKTFFIAFGSAMGGIAVVIGVYFVVSGPTIGGGGAGSSAAARYTRVPTTRARPRYARPSTGMR
jgi:hypothetical protein